MDKIPLTKEGYARLEAKLKTLKSVERPTVIRAIIPGRVATIRVAVGDVVEAGQGILVVEAMKMQNELRAPRAGTIDRVAVAEGQTIDNGDLLAVLR